MGPRPASDSLAAVTLLQSCAGAPSANIEPRTPGSPTDATDFLKSVLPAANLIWTIRESLEQIRFQMRMNLKLGIIQQLEVFLN